MNRICFTQGGSGQQLNIVGAESAIVFRNATGDIIKTIQGKGTVFKIKENIVSVDGKMIQDINPDKAPLELHITIEGPVAGSITLSSGNINVLGDVKGNVATTSGKVEVQGNVLKNIQCTSGNVNIKGNVGGRISVTSGMVNCGSNGQ